LRRTRRLGRAVTVCGLGATGLRDRLLAGVIAGAESHLRGDVRATRPAGLGHGRPRAPSRRPLRLLALLPHKALSDVGPRSVPEAGGLPGQPPRREAFALGEHLPRRTGVVLDDLVQE